MLKWLEQRSFGILMLLAAGLLAAQMLSLLAMGLPLICPCGSIDFWHGNPSGPETSQHLSDWYTYTHIAHGFGFYLLLWLFLPRTSFAVRLLLAIAIEAGWEVLENTPFIVERYRQLALARGYFGDSAINSVFDTLAMIVGFVLARVSPVWLSILLVAGLELILAATIRDNLTLNILQLVYPTETISNWQSGG